EREFGYRMQAPNIYPLSAGVVFASEVLCWQPFRLSPTDRAHLMQMVAYALPHLLNPQELTTFSRSPQEWSPTQWLKIYQRVYRRSGTKRLVAGMRRRAKEFE